jgi:VanZ family protein
MPNFVRYHAPALLCAALILAVSSIPHLKAPDPGIWGVDKLFHFAEYAVLAFLLWRSVHHRVASFSRARLQSGLFLVVFAALDEVLQGFVPGRQTDPLDYLADLAGGLLVLALVGRRARKGPS